MSGAPENLVLQPLRGIRADVAAIDAKIDRKVDDLRSEMNSLRGELRSEINSLRADVAADLHELRAEMASQQKETREQIVGLRRAVIEYHSTVVGHGILISELEERVRRVEQHLNLPPLNAH